MAKRKGGKSKGYQSKGSVGTTKNGWTGMTILQSMMACLFDGRGNRRTKDSGKTYDIKEPPRKGNEHKAEQRRAKKKAKRLAKKENNNGNE